MENDKSRAAVLIEVCLCAGPPTPARAPARQLWPRRPHISHFGRSSLTLWRSSLSDSRSSWRRRILSWKIQDTLSCVRKQHFTSTTLVRSRYLQPGESTQVGAVLDVDVGGAAATAAVRVLGGFRHGGHCRWFVSRSAVGATLPVGHRSTSESASGKRARSSRSRPPAAPRLAPAARSARRRPPAARRRSPGRPAGWSSRIVLPPPRTPLSAFYRHARLNAVAFLHYLFCPKNWQNPSKMGRQSKDNDWFTNHG